MENRSHALLAGLFTLLLGLTAVAALWWLGGRHEATQDIIVLTQKNITGLNSQAQVRYRGVRVGRVEAINLDSEDMRNTLIRIRIRAGIPVTEATVAKLGYQGVTGIAHVQLEESRPDAAPLVAQGTGLRRIQMQDSMMQELSDAGAETLRNARDFLAHANQLLSPENRQSISKTLANLEASSGNAREASAQLRQLLTPENVQRMQSTLARAEQTVGQAAPFFAEARGLVSRLQSVSDKLDQTLGDPASGGGALVPKLNELSSELSTSSRQLNRVLQMLEDSPQSLIFGRQPGTPGPGEAGFVTPIPHATHQGTP
jgi:phospholipid/cholesterol/gamma-HCH transport system substrate-binding protein